MYLKLSDRYSLHLQPNGGSLDLLPVLAKSDPAPNAWLTRAAAALVSRCAGQVHLRELAREAGFTADELGEFLEWALQEGFLELHDTPQPGAIRVAGSFEYYSPVHVCIELTNACNLTCRHCYRDSHPGLADRLPTAHLLRILSDMRESGVFSVELTGGEPLIHPDFRVIVDACARQFNAVVILTNGWLVDHSMARFLGAYRDRIFVQVDLDGPAADVHDALRGVPGSFGRACTAIQALAGEAVYSRVVMNVYRDNIRYVEDTFALARRLGGSCFSSALVMDYGRGRDIEMPDSEQVGAYAELILRLSRDHPRFFFPNEDLCRRIKDLGEGCGAGKTKLALGPTGKLRPCLIMREDNATLGDLTRQSYREFLAGADLGIFHRLDVPTRERCAPCEFAQYCHRCMARPFALRKRLGADAHHKLCTWDQKWNLVSQLAADDACVPLAGADHSSAL